MKSHIHHRELAAPLAAALFVAAVLLYCWPFIAAVTQVAVGIFNWGRVL